MNQKALFFDIDGTLFHTKTGQIPPSAVQALVKAREHGHLVFVNTGRVLCHVGTVKAVLQMDGYLCGCGTCIQVGDEILYQHRIPRERGIQIKRDLIRFGLDGVLEGTEHCYFQDHISPIPSIERLKEDLYCCEGVVSARSWEDHSYDFDKFFVRAQESTDLEGFRESMKPDMELTDRGRGYFEGVPAGHSKATAIEFILKKYQIPLEDAYVFGDSTNDLSMFQYVPNAILMGKHDKELGPHASFTTKTVEEDGILYAMEALGII